MANNTTSHQVTSVFIINYLFMIYLMQVISEVKSEIFNFFSKKNIVFFFNHVTIYEIMKWQEIVRFTNTL